MNTNLFKTAAFLCGVSCFSSLSAQYISITPPSISYTPSAVENVADIPEVVELAIKTDATSWTVNFIATPLISATHQNIIPEDCIFIRHEYSQQNGMLPEDSYQQLGVPLMLASGGPTAGEYKVVNRLQFRIQFPPGLETDTYTGEFRIQYQDNYGQSEEILLSVSVSLSPFFQIVPSLSQLQLTVNGQPDFYNFNHTLQLNLLSSSASCNFTVELAPLRSFSGKFLPPEFIYIMLPGITSNHANDNFVNLKQPFRTPIELSPSPNSILHERNISVYLKIKTEWQFETGIYKSELKIYAESTPEKPIIIPILVRISEVSVLILSENSVNFHVNGPPQVWKADKSVKLFVGSNSGLWSVHCETTELIGSKGLIPASRLFLRTQPNTYQGSAGAGYGYQPLGDQIEIATGGPIDFVEISDMQLKLKTIETDRPGHYEGKVIFTLLANP